MAKVAICLPRIYALLLPYAQNPYMVEDAM